jgi:hypothetical protein
MLLYSTRVAAENKFLSKDERANMTVLIEEACGFSEHR